MCHHCHHYCGHCWTPCLSMFEPLQGEKTIFSKSVFKTFSSDHHNNCIGRAQTYIVFCSNCIASNWTKITYFIPTFFNQLMSSPLIQMIFFLFLELSCFIVVILFWLLNWVYEHSLIAPRSQTGYSRCWTHWLLLQVYTLAYCHGNQFFPLGALGYKGAH